MAQEKELIKLKAAADSSYRFDDYYTALQQYLDALRVAEAAFAVSGTLRQACEAALSRGHWAAAAVFSAAAGLFNAAENADQDKRWRELSADASTGAVMTAVLAAAERLDQVAEYPDVVAGLCSNLALCLTALRLWPQLQVGALAASVLSSKLRPKNISRFVIAAAHLGHPMLCSEEFRDPTIAESLHLIGTQSAGAYDFGALSKGQSGASWPVAEYRAPFSVAVAPGCGFGLFAQHAIARGALVLCEHAVGYSTVTEDRTGAAAMSRLVKSNAIACTGFEMRRVAVLYDGTPRPQNVTADFVDVTGLPRYTVLQFWTRDVTELAVGAMPVEHLAGAIRCNAYMGESYLEQLPSDSVGVGLFPTAAMINHSATPNLARQCIGKFVLFTATRDITPGEELTSTYVANTCYLQEDQPLERWGVTLPRAPQVQRLRACDDALGASLEKLMSWGEAIKEDLLATVEAPCRRAFIVNAGLFAAITKLDSHPAFVALLDELNGTPDICTLEQCAKITKRFAKKIHPPTLARLEDALRGWCLICLGHSNLAAAAARVTD